MTRKVLSSNYAQRPLWVNGLNKLWSMAWKAGLKVKLEKDSLITGARKKTGYSDLGQDFPEEAFDRLLLSIREEADLHPLGAFITRQRMINLLSTRLRAEHWFKRHPEILEAPLYPVVLIAGLQRTGTTKLQRMLAMDPDIRSLRSWEAINPAPLNGHIHEKHLRIREARMSEKALRLLSPGFFTIHPVEHLEPEEDILLLDVSFMSTTPEATMHVPSYASWLEDQDQSHAYEYASRLLKFLQYQRPASRWVLKSPHHLEFLDLAQKYFGVSYHLWTHRDLNDCVPSFISMMAYSRSVFSDNVDPEKVASHWLRKNSYIIKKAINFRSKQQNKNISFKDIWYDEFTSDPIKIIREIYSSLGGFTEELAGPLVELEDTDFRGKYGHHIYKMQDFGIDENMIDKYFSDYKGFLESISNR